PVLDQGGFAVLRGKQDQGDGPGFTVLEGVDDFGLEPGGVHVEELLAERGEPFGPSAFDGACAAGFLPLLPGGSTLLAPLPGALRAFGAAASRGGAADGVDFGSEPLVLVPVPFVALPCPAGPDQRFGE